MEERKRISVFDRANWTGVGSGLVVVAAVGARLFFLNRRLGSGGWTAFLIEFGAFLVIAAIGTAIALRSIANNRRASRNRSQPLNMD